MRVETATDWQHVNELLFSDTFNSGINRYRSTFAYRGVSDESYSLSNGLSRLGTPYPNMELNLLKQFKKYAHRNVVEKDTEWHWLSVAQHYGLPTRLLDWTYSPFIALHFATTGLTKHPTQNAAVWKVNYADVHDLLQAQEKANLSKIGAKIFSLDALAESIKDTEQLDNRSAAHYKVAVFFEPPAIDDRIVNQFAYFSAISDPFMSFDDWLALPNISTSVDAVKIVIPYNLLWEIRDKLDQSNINERVLFPGLDGLCSWLKRHYTPR